jgi:hypothetical protein
MTVKLSRQLTFVFVLITSALLLLTVVKGELGEPGYYFAAAMVSNFIMLTMLLVHINLKNKAKAEEEEQS